MNPSALRLLTIIRKTHTRTLGNLSSYYNNAAPNTYSIIALSDDSLRSQNSIMADHVKNNKIDRAQQVFDSIPNPNIISWTTLISGYTKLRKIERARQLFDKMPERNEVSWNAMITGYVQNGMMEEAKSLLNLMPQKNVVTWTIMLKGYADCGRINEAQTLFRDIPHKTVISWTVMVKGLVQNGKLEDARKVFDRMPHRNVISWTVMVTGYAQNGRLEDARQLFDKMPQRDVVAWNAMLSGYVQNKRMDEATRLFETMPQKDDVSWNLMISGYGKSGQVENALGMFEKFSNRDVVSWNAMIMALMQNNRVDDATVMFEKMPERDLVSWNVMLAGCFRNKRMDEARQLFEKMEDKDAVSFSSMIAGYAQIQQGEAAFKLYVRMKRLGLFGKVPCLTSVLSSCGDLAIEEQGKQVHVDALKLGSFCNVYVGSALISMYCKCGSIQHARNVFDKIPIRDATLWNSMISGYASHGHGNEALVLFKEMQRDKNSKPDAATFVGVLCACSHAGLVDEGLRYFENMKREYSVDPIEEHYGCVVDLLGRAGRLDEAENLIKDMAIQPPASVFGALLGSCRVHKRPDLARRWADHILSLGLLSSETYVSLSNVFASSGRWEDVMNVRKIMKNKGIKKNPGCSWIEVNKRVHTFVTGDTSHPETEKIHAALKALSQKMEESGYLPHREFVLHDVEEQEKDQILNYHSERLAIAYGLINTPYSTLPVRIFKNLRVCGDCHSATKLISKLVQREIIVRDTNRFHRFKDGSCSCADYW